MTSCKSALIGYNLELIMGVLRQKNYVYPVLLSIREDHYVLTTFCLGVPKTFTFDDDHRYLSIEYFRKTDSFRTNSFDEMLSIISNCTDAREEYV